MISLYFLNKIDICTQFTPLLWLSNLGLVKEHTIHKERPKLDFDQRAGFDEHRKNLKRHNEKLD